MPTKQIALVFVVLLLLATTAAGWKWGGASGHKSATQHSWID